MTGARAIQRVLPSQGKQRSCRNQAFLGTRRSRLFVAIITKPPRGSPINHNLRAILWIATMAYFGFLFAGRGVPSFNAVTISGGVIGAVVGLLLSIMFARRAKRKKT